jgi:hypothetical protein
MLVEIEIEMKILVDDMSLMMEHEKLDPVMRWWTIKEQCSEIMNPMKSGKHNNWSKIG